MNEIELSARMNGPPRLNGKGLIVICSYRGGVKREGPKRATIDGPIGRLVDYLTLMSLREFIGRCRDHAANARSLEYQLMVARAVIALGSFKAFEIVIDSPLAKHMEQPIFADIEPVRVETVGPGTVSSQSRWDTVVLIYPDALGLSWDGLEKAARASVKNTVVVNGRRRIFTLDPSARKSLRIRRFLATTRLSELLFSALIIPVAAVYAVVDAVRGRS